MDIVFLAAFATQYGSLQGRGTDMATLHLHTLMHHLAASATSLLLFFADLRTAFYRVIKEILLRLPRQADDLQAAVEDMEIPLCFQDVLEQTIAGPTILDQVLPDEHLRAMIADNCYNNWFSVKGTDVIANQRHQTWRFSCGRPLQPGGRGVCRRPGGGDRRRCGTGGGGPPGPSSSAAGYHGVITPPLG